MFKCTYCGRSNFLSERGVTQHIALTQSCKQVQLDELQGNDRAYRTAHEFMELSEIRRRSSRTDRPLEDDNTLPRSRSSRSSDTHPDDDNMSFSALPDDNSEEDAQTTEKDGQDSVVDKSILLVGHRSQKLQ